MTTMLFGASAAICFLTIGFQVFSSLTLFRFRVKRDDFAIRHPEDFSLPGVSIIVPVKGPVEHLEKSVHSLLKQNYRGPWEIIFAFQDALDPSLSELENLLKRTQSTAKINIMRGLPFLGLNPKNSNLAHGYKAANFPWIFFCDIDTRFSSSHISDSMALARADESNYVTAVSVHEGAKTFGALLESISTNLSLVSFFLMTYSYDKNPGPINGASNLFSKKLMEKSGGIEQILNVLTEDAVLERAFKKVGARGHLAPDFARVTLQNQSLKGFVQRQLRWIMIAKCYFYPQCLITPLLWVWQWLVLIGFLTGVSSLWIFGLTILACRILNSCVYQILLGVPTKDIPRAFFLPICDIVIPALWIAGLPIQHVTWAGKKLQVKRSGDLEGYPSH